MGKLKPHNESNLAPVVCAILEMGGGYVPRHSNWAPIEISHHTQCIGLPGQISNKKNFPNITANVSLFLN